MVRKYLWVHLATVAVLATTLVAMAGTNGVTPVTEDEGARVQGGSTGCTQYASSTVQCGSGYCGTTLMTCPTQNRLSSGSGTSATDVTQYNGNGYCQVCGSNLCANTLNITGWNPCTQ
jgi:hypothetical protein